MSNTTSRLGLVQPVGGDSPSALRTSITSNTNMLDNAVIVTEGTLVNRPLAAAVEHDRVFRATDTAQWFIGDGTNWTQLGVYQTSSVAGAVNAVSGQRYVCAPSTTITLPSPATAGQTITVVANGSVASGTPVTVSGPGIYGPGLSNASSLLLGLPGAYVTLVSHDSNFWNVLAGGEDTGWVALTLGTNVTQGDQYTPAYRRVNGEIRLRGTLRATGTVSGTAATASVPSAFAPPGGNSTVYLNTAVISTSSNAQAGPVYITGSSFAGPQPSNSIISTNGMVSGWYIPLNGCNYQTS